MDKQIDKLRYIERYVRTPLDSFPSKISRSRKVFSKTKKSQRSFATSEERRETKYASLDWAKRRTWQRLFHASLPNPIIQE